MSQQALPLDGIRVIEYRHFLAGAYLRHGLGDKELAPRNPGLVNGSASAHGHTGRNSHPRCSALTKPWPTCK